MNPFNDWLCRGADCLNQGQLSEAIGCFVRAAKIDPGDLRAPLNLANAEREAGEHGQARQRYEALLRALPDNRIVRRNALTGLVYDPGATDAERLIHARAWGQWAIAQKQRDTHLLLRDKTKGHPLTKVETKGHPKTKGHPLIGRNAAFPRHLDTTRQVDVPVVHVLVHEQVTCRISL